MARPGFTYHWKFHTACVALDISDAYVLGLIEMMWMACCEEASPDLGDRVGVERAARWPGEPGLFAAAVISAGLVDEGEDGFCRVHDFWNHAPEYVLRTAERDLLRRERGPVDRARPSASGFVYVMRCGDLYKIGFSSDPERRLLDVANGGAKGPRGPVSLELRIPSQQMREQERRLHRRYAAVRRVGEWFALEPWMLTELESEVPL